MVVSTEFCCDLSTIDCKNGNNLGVVSPRRGCHLSLTGCLPVFGTYFVITLTFYCV